MLRFGTQDNDEFFLSSETRETVFGFGGEDIFQGVNFFDNIFAGSGDDFFLIGYDVGSGLDTPFFGAPTIHGGPGEDTVQFLPGTDYELREFPLLGATRIHFLDSDVMMWTFGVEGFYAIPT